MGRRRITRDYVPVDLIGNIKLLFRWNKEISFSLFEFPRNEPCTRDVLPVCSLVSMDDRLWWFATKLQEAFTFGALDSPTLLEDFLTTPETADLISIFLTAAGPTKLFFYCDRAQLDSLSTRNLTLSSSLLPERLRNGSTCLYFLKTAPIDVRRLEEEISCGKISGSSPLVGLDLALRGVYSHYVEAIDEKATDGVPLRSLVDHLSSSIRSTSKTSGNRRMRLEEPSDELIDELKRLQVAGRQNLSSTSTNSISEAEKLVGEWFVVIEGLLLTGVEERRIFDV